MMNSENYNVAMWGIAKDGMTNVLVSGELGSGISKIMDENPRTGKSIIRIENPMNILCQPALNSTSVIVLNRYALNEFTKNIKSCF
ncbi:hypothetical protein [Providencia rettgeri]|uniref:hypothetical protein n=1 Tax=Providencia rettgeri TaxID=587 RepID=UPI0024B91840|nr:hypothetical protein [Providencia rettgeri]WHT81962.1 hypothetical protein KOL65_21815 [Providencia rettgeri]